MLFKTWRGLLSLWTRIVSVFGLSCHASETDAKLGSGQLFCLVTEDSYIGADVALYSIETSAFPHHSTWQNCSSAWIPVVCSCTCLAIYCWTIHRTLWIWSWNIITLSTNSPDNKNILQRKRLHVCVNACRCVCVCVCVCVKWRTSTRLDLWSV